jgi:glycosyltransferase involved in cell wall biosynthesis
MLAMLAILAMNSWHLVTPEFPPALGGVSEHSRVLAEAAVGRGLDVHVWTAGSAAVFERMPGVEVHATLAAFGDDDLERTGRLLDAFPAPRTIVLQWVPHGYGRRGMNLRFATWMARRAAAGDRLDVMVHEPFVDYFGGSWIQPVRAVVQRSMTRAVLGAARRVWLSIPGWEERLSSMLPPATPARVLPVPGTIPVDRDPAAVAAARARVIGGARFVVGYFGTGGSYVDRALARTIAQIRATRPDIGFALIGRGTGELAGRLSGLTGIAATGSVPAAALSHYLQACDLLLQPYVDGVSGRRTTTVSALEHAVPVATTFGRLSEPFWRDTAAVETVAAAAPERLAAAVLRLLEPARNAEGRSAALALYAARFDPRVVLDPLFAD